MSRVVKRTGRKNNEEPTDREEPIKKWRLTFGRERYPTVPIIVRKTEEPGEKPEADGGDSVR